MLRLSGRSRPIALAIRVSCGKASRSSGDSEALRDLTRAREDMKHLQRQAKQRPLSFLSRHGHRYAGRSRWTQAHWRWLEGIKFVRPEQQIGGAAQAGGGGRLSFCYEAG